MNKPAKACSSQRRKWWRTKRIQALAISLATLSASNVGAQDPVTVRGIEFDPLILESADIESMERIGIERRLQAQDPVSSGNAVWRMLQFSRPIDRALRNDLSTRGLQLTRYIDGIYIERVSADQVDALKAGQILRAGPRYHPAFKLFPSIRGDKIHEDRDFITDRRRALPGRWFQATVFVSADADQIAAQVSNTDANNVVVHGSRDVRGPQLIVFSLDGAGDLLERQLADVAQLEGIESISEVGEFINLNVNAASMNQSGSSTDPALWNRDIRGTDQMISIIDDGVADKDHCLFRDDDNPVGPQHRKLRDVRSQSLLGHSHSTWVAGNAAGDDINGSGMHSARGGAWAAKLVLVNRNDFDVVNYPGRTPPSSFWDELVNAKDKGARIHNNSWLEATTPAEDYSPNADDIDDFSRKFEEQLVVAAAGYNGGTEWGAPALAKNALTVGAANTDASSICSVFDTPPLSMRQKPDMAVVAQNVSSPKPVFTMGGAVKDCETPPKGCATSHAAPHASALAALARQYFVDGHYDGDADLSSPTGALIKAVLINSARDVSSEFGFPSHREGWGIANLNNTLVSTDSPVKLWVEDVRNKNAGALQTGEFHEYEITVSNSGSPLKVTLVWMDLSSGPGIGVVSNNLDLEVMAPASETPSVTYLGNDFHVPTGVSKTGGSADSLNNVEQVLVAAPSTGPWTIRVTGTHLPNIALGEGEQGQGYALIATFGDNPPERPTPPTDLETR